MYAAFLLKSKAKRTAIGPKAVAKISDRTPAKRTIWMNERISSVTRTVNKRYIHHHDHRKLSVLCSCLVRRRFVIHVRLLLLCISHRWRYRCARFIQLLVSMSIATWVTNIYGGILRAYTVQRVRGFRYPIVARQGVRRSLHCYQADWSECVSTFASKLKNVQPFGLLPTIHKYVRWTILWF